MLISSITKKYLKKLFSVFVQLRVTVARISGILYFLFFRSTILSTKLEPLLRIILEQMILFAVRYLISWKVEIFLRIQRFSDFDVKVILLILQFKISFFETRSILTPLLRTKKKNSMERSLAKSNKRKNRRHFEQWEYSENSIISSSIVDLLHFAL